jgi:hypothetical protein
VIDFGEFLDDHNLLGPWFAGDSWGTWKVVLKAAFGEELTEAETSRFRDIADRDPPETRVRELWLAIGRRAGKDSIASAVAAWAAVFGDFGRYLRPGEKAVILCLAVNRDQASIVFDYIRGYFERVPMLAQLVERVDADTITLDNGVEITVATNSYRSIRGRTVAICVMDELAFWRDESGPYTNPDIELYRAVQPGLTTLRKAGAMVIAISTVYRRSGLLYNKIRQHLGQPGDILAILQPSIVFNPSLDQAEIDRDLAEDPERFAAEWLSQWRSDISDLFDRELVEAAVDPGLYVRPPRAWHAYRAFADPSGGRGDSFTVAIAHDEDETVLVDLVFERKAPFDPSSATSEIAALLRSYGCSEVTGDKYAAQWVIEAFAKVGVTYLQSERDRSQLYLDALPAFTAGRVRLPDHRQLVNQLCSLERRATRTGRDIVNHPIGGADDLANSVCGVIAASAVRQPPVLWDFRADLRRWLAEHPEIPQ